MEVKCFTALAHAPTPSTAMSITWIEASGALARMTGEVKYAGCGGASDVQRLPGAKEP